jgi:hypothetical protein
MPSHSTYVHSNTTNNTSRYNGVIIEFPMIENEKEINFHKKIIDDDCYRRPTNFRAMKILAKPTE